MSKVLVCIDFGASTGGFTDCLLQRGAAKVYAIDVGTNQLDWRMRSDSRVVVREGVNARYPEDVLPAEPVNFAVCDVSFISATLIVPALTCAPQFVLLVKPQFEVGREQVGKGGIVRDAALHAKACEKVQSAVRAQGYRTDIMESPITGAEGNKEFLLHAYR